MRAAGAANDKNLADLPSSCPPCESRRSSARVISTGAAPGVPFPETEGRYVSFCKRAATWAAPRCIKSLDAACLQKLTSRRVATPCDLRFFYREDGSTGGHARP